MLRSYILGQDGEALEWHDLAAVLADYHRRDATEPQWRRLRVTDLRDGRGQPCRVSTVFIGLVDLRDRRRTPKPWQTVVFGGERDALCRQYPTREDAIKGHEDLVTAITTEAELAEGLEEEDL